MFQLAFYAKEKGYWFIILTNNNTQLFIRGNSVNIERNYLVWIVQ